MLPNLSGHKEALKWFLDCLRDALQDRQIEAVDESIPLLPISDESVSAMDDHIFLNFIAKLGMSPPSNEQVRLSVTNSTSCKKKKKKDPSLNYRPIN